MEMTVNILGYKLYYFQQDRLANNKYQVTIPGMTSRYFIIM